MFVGCWDVFGSGGKPSPQTNTTSAHEHWRQSDKCATVQLRAEKDIDFLFLDTWLDLHTKSCTDVKLF